MNNQYSNESFWKKLKSFGKKAGQEVCETALKLYYAANDKETPLWAKTTIFSALAYFILPIDAIPDVVPVAGFSDDLVALSGAIATTAAYIKDEHVNKAKETVKRWLD